MRCWSYSVLSILFYVGLSVYLGTSGQLEEKGPSSTANFLHAKSTGSGDVTNRFAGDFSRTRTRRWHLRSL